MSQINSYNRTKIVQDFSAGPLDFITSFTTNFQVQQVLIHLIDTKNEVIRISFLSRDGKEYDVELFRSSDYGTDCIWRPSGNCIFMTGDELRIQCVGINKKGFIYATVIVEPQGSQPAKDAIQRIAGYQ